MSDQVSEVAAFIDSYRHAFEALDASRIAEHFAYPLHIAGDGRDVSLATAANLQDWLGSLERLVDLYRSVGVHEARLLGLVETPIAPRLAQVLVHWGLMDLAGEPIYDFHAGYTVAKMGDGLRIVAIAHDEVPRYRAYLARRQPAA